MVMGPAGPRTKNDCWQIPAAIYPEAEMGESWLLVTLNM